MFNTPLVSTDWLAEHLDDDNLRLIDIRGRVLPATEPPPHYHSHRDHYDEAHIPGAVFVDWTQDIVDPSSPTGMLIASPEDFAALMGRLGIDDTRYVVAYDDAGGMFAARMWWALRYYGHEAVAVLDGGWQKWLAEGRATTADLPLVTPAMFIPVVNPALRFTVQTVNQSVTSGGAQLVDVRSPGEFAGEASRTDRFGHIPGAVNLPRKSLLASDGTLNQPELHDRISAAGITVDADETLVTYCNAGVSASYVMLALATAGVQNVAIYDGSWKEWSRDPDNAVQS